MYVAAAKAGSTSVRAMNKLAAFTGTKTAGFTWVVRDPVARFISAFYHVHVGVNSSSIREPIVRYSGIPQGSCGGWYHRDWHVTEDIDSALLAFCEEAVPQVLRWDSHFETQIGYLKRYPNPVAVILTQDLDLHKNEKHAKRGYTPSSGVLETVQRIVDLHYGEDLSLYINNVCESKIS